jgi:hypothetical protein
MLRRGRERQVYRVYDEDELLDDDPGTLEGYSLRGPEYEAGEPLVQGSPRARSSRVAAVVAVALVAMVVSALAVHAVRSVVAGRAGSVAPTVTPLARPAEPATRSAEEPVAGRSTLAGRDPSSGRQVSSLPRGGLSASNEHKPSREPRAIATTPVSARSSRMAVLGAQSGAGVAGEMDRETAAGDAPAVVPPAQAAPEFGFEGGVQ